MIELVFKDNTITISIIAKRDEYQPMANDLAIQALTDAFFNQHRMVVMDRIVLIEPDALTHQFEIKVLSQGSSKESSKPFQEPR